MTTNTKSDSLQPPKGGGFSPTSIMTTQDGFHRLLTYISKLGVELDGKVKGGKIELSYNDKVKLQKIAYLMGELSGKPLYSDWKLGIKGVHSRKLMDDYHDRKVCVKEVSR